jgi:hypothetical protein
MNDYRKLWIEYYGAIPIDENGRSYEIHHKDGNKNNNSIENLQCLSISEHFKIHLEQKDFTACSLIASRMSNSNFSGYKLKPLSKETKQKIRNKLLGTLITESTKRKISLSLKGRKFSEIHKQKISNNSIGNKSCLGLNLWPNGRSVDVKKKISESLKGNKNCVGRILSAETKEKMRKSALNRKKKK